MIITTLRDTLLKDVPLQSSHPDVGELIEIKKGTKFRVHSSTKAQNGHLRVALLASKGIPVKLGRSGRNTWYLFKDHWDLSELDLEETEILTPKLKRVNNFHIGNDHVIDWTNFSCPISEHFNVGEATHFQNARIPKSNEVKRNILILARQLDMIRDAYGQPLFVTSWYRPTKINRRVGGVPNSTHLTGLAADVYPKDGNVRRFQNYCVRHWYGEVGLGAPKEFVHLGMRNGKGFKTGGAKGARWNY